MAIRPSYKLEPGDDHGLIELERAPDGGINLLLHGVPIARDDDEPVFIKLRDDEATELAAMLRSVLGHGLSSEDAVTLGIDGNEPVGV
jgi:hypothetical protein